LVRKRDFMRERGAARFLFGMASATSNSNGLVFLADWACVAAE
jgi:hypothetical protein